jgi:O-antigen/teichoic acid export membrane protein
LLVAGKTMLAKLSMDSLGPYRYLIPVGVAGMGAYLVLTQWAIREKLFNTIARTRVTQSLSGAATMIVMGFLGLRPFGLLIGKIIGQAGGITTLAKSILKQKGFPKPPLEDIKRVAVRYRKFPMFETWSGILNTMGAQITPILLVALFNPEVAGFFAMAQNLLILPSAFVGLAIGQVFIQKASVARYEGKLKEVTMKAYSILFQLGLFPILLLSLFSPVIFSFFLGARWVEAGFFARIMGLWVALAFVCSPMDVLFSVMDIQGIRLLVEAFQTLFRMLAIYIGGKIGGPYWAIGLFSLVGVSVYLVKLFILLRGSGNKMDEIFEKLIKRIFLSLSLLLFPLAAVLLSIPLVFQILMALVSLTLFLILLCVPQLRRSGY